MAVYKERPNLFDAYTFTGGKKDAKALMKWLKKYEMGGSWSPALKLDTDETTRESFVILNCGRADRIYIGTTIVFDRRDRSPEYRLMYEVDFHAKYEIHEEE